MCANGHRRLSSHRNGNLSDLSQSTSYTYLTACSTAVDVFPAAALAGHGSRKLKYIRERQPAAVDDQPQRGIQSRKVCCLCLLASFL